MGNVVFLNQSKKIKAMTSDVRSICPLCDLRVEKGKPLKDGQKFVCDNVQHGSFTWTERACDKFGMVSS